MCHESCPECGSKDNLGRFSDGHGYCFGCEYYEPAEGDTHKVDKPLKKNPELIRDGWISALPARGITEETASKFHYEVGKAQGRPVHIANYYNASGTRLVAQKVRYVKDKDFRVLGNIREAGLYGQHLWPRGGKKVVVTEGELDALAVSQIQGNKWPVVSIPSGAQGAKRELSKHIEWLEAFDDVVLMFDQDSAGRKAMEDCAELFSPMKAKIASLPENDPCDCLSAGKGDAIIKGMWNAKPHQPGGIVQGADLWDRLQNRPQHNSYAYPSSMPELNEKTYGIRMGELDTWTSGSGSGKTTLIKQLQHHIHQTTDLAQAVIHLEEPLEDTTEGLMGIHLGKRLTLPDVRDGVALEDYKQAFDDLFISKTTEGNYKLNLYDAFGAMDKDSLYNKIRFFAKGLGCSAVWLDHLSIMVSDLGLDTDERRAIDSIMHNLKSLTQELGIFIGLIVHLKKAPDGKSFEDGFVPSMDDLRGSGGIKQLSNNVYALSRNQQAEDSRERNTSLISVLKCRFTGNTGPADRVWFNPETGRMEEADSAIFASESEPNDSVKEAEELF